MSGAGARVKGTRKPERQLAAHSGPDPRDGGVRRDAALVGAELLAGAGGEVRAEGPPLHAGKEARLGSEARCPRMGATRSCGLYLRFDPVDGGATLTGPLGLGCDWVG